MKLTPQELQSSTWLKLSSHLKEQLTSLRSRNDGEMSDIATARLRGEIAFCKRILSLGASLEKVQPDAD